MSNIRKDNTQSSKGGVVNMDFDDHDVVLVD